MDVTHVSFKQVMGFHRDGRQAGRADWRRAAGYFGMTFLVRAKQTVNHIQPSGKNKDGTAGS